MIWRALKIAMKRLFSSLKKSSQLKEIDEIGPVLFAPSHRARRMSITVKTTGEVRVAVPQRASMKEAERFVVSKREWIKRQLGRGQDFRMAVDEYTERVAALDIDSAVTEITARLQELAEMFGFSYNKLTIRNQKTRWGSCSNQNNLSLNIKLALLPDELRDLILVHELIHTKIKNHSPTFWRELESIYPNARELDRQVNRLGGLLRIPLAR